MLSLRGAVSELLCRSITRTLPDGSTKWTFAGTVHFEIKEALWKGFQEGRLQSQDGALVAEKDGRAMRVQFGKGHSTQNYVWFDYVDAR